MNNVDLKKNYLKPFRRFNLNYDRLYRWYLATLISYENSQEKIAPIISKKKADKLPREKIYYKQEVYGTTHLIQHDITDLQKKYEKGYNSFLDEMVLIRLVSLLEVLLVDLIESGFYYNKRLFFDNTKISIPIAEYLSKDKETLDKQYIDNLTRTFGNKGFDGITKFYKKNFKIDLRLFSITNTNNSDITYTYADLQKFHNNRHLIIHKLGKVDEAYNHKYNNEVKKIALTQNDIFFYFDLIHYFAKYLDDSFQEKILK